MVSTWRKEGATVPSHEPKHPIRSSAAEYLTFVAATGDGAESMEMRYEDENIWLTQKMMAALYDVSVSAINQHLKTIEYRQRTYQCQRSKCHSTYGNSRNHIDIIVRFLGKQISSSYVKGEIHGVLIFHHRPHFYNKKK